jgi:predicted RNA-binding protein with RPS1 domain
MKDYQVGDLIVGTVSSVRPYAIFMDFDEDTCGLLHISEVSDSFVRDIEKYAYAGDKLKVKIIAVDPLNGFLRVSLKKVPEAERYSTHKNTYRKRIEVTNADFKPLQDNLNGWIKYTLAKKEEEEND